MNYLSIKTDESTRLHILEKHNKFRQQIAHYGIDIEHLDETHENVTAADMNALVIKLVLFSWWNSSKIPL